MLLLNLIETLCNVQCSFLFYADLYYSHIYTYESRAVWIMGGNNLGSYSFGLYGGRHTAWCSTHSLPSGARNMGQNRVACPDACRPVCCTAHLVRVPLHRGSALTGSDSDEFESHTTLFILPATCFVTNEYVQCVHAMFCSLHIVI